jgi:chromosomal replication initiator protein
MNQNFLGQFLKIQPNVSSTTPEVTPVKTPEKSETLRTSEELILLNIEINNILKDLVEPTKFSTYFGDKVALKEWNSNGLIFEVQTNFIKKVIEGNYLNQLQKAIQLTIGNPLKFELIVSNQMTIDDIAEEVKKNQSNSDYQIRKASNVKNTVFSINDEETANSNKTEITTIADKNSKIDPNKTFENFVVGASNNLAFASCQAVADSPGKAYPSLYLYSASGLGKTHLLNSIANRIMSTKPNLNIVYISCGEFIRDFIASVEQKKFSEFQRKFTEDADVLIIDDIHELKNKTETQNAFFNIFNELHNKGKQLIFTSDKAPKEITGIDERVKTRLAWGLNVDIQQPDLETRIAILKRKAIEKDIYLPEDVVNLIASSIKSNVRELESSLIRLGLYSSVCKVDIDVEIAREQLKLNSSVDVSNLSLDSISKAVCSYFKVTVNDLKSKSRTKELADARHIAMYLSNKILKATLVEIADFYGKRDHTSVIHGVKKVEDLIKYDQKVAQTLLEIENSL